jgi:hypothetical protein
MWFGIYLYDRKLITAEQLAAALRKRFRSHTPLGRLAIESGKLNPQQLYELLLLQIHDRRPLGELAIEMKLLTRQDLADLLLIQAEQAMSLSDALVEMGVFTSEAVNAHLLEGRVAMAERAQDEVGLATSV